MSQSPTLDYSKSYRQQLAVLRVLAGHASWRFTDGWEGWVAMPPQHVVLFSSSGAREDGLAAWAERTGRRSVTEPVRGRLRFAFYGRVSTEDHQDPVTSWARQRDQAVALVAGHGRIVAEYFGIGQSRTLSWARRPQAAALLAAMADPDREFDAIVIGEYERAFYGGQYAAMAPLFEHHGIQLWTPEAGGPIDFQAEGTCSVGRRAHRLEPDPHTAPVVRWMFTQRLAGHSAARITRALNDAGVPCPSAADPGRNPHRTGAAWT